MTGPTTEPGRRPATATKETTTDTTTGPTLAELLELERIDVDLFRAQDRSGSPAPRLYGGQVAAQALRAAAETVPEGQDPHSLHAYFLRPGRANQPVVLHVDRTRDGRSFATRRIRVTQEGETIFALTASFHRAEPGTDAGLVEPLSLERPAVPPEGGPRLPLRIATAAEGFALPVAARDDGPPRLQAWVRVRTGGLPMGPLPDACVLAYISDLAAVPAVVQVMEGGQKQPGMVASLDHAVWFHRPFRADSWLLMESSPVSVGGARGLAFGNFWTEEGMLVASLAQEALVRAPREQG